MTGLVIKLGPKERLLVNGAVVENGDRRSRFTIISPNAKILRLRDAIHPDHANTPVRRACYTAQLVLTGDASSEATIQQMLGRIEELSQVMTDSDSRKILGDATEALAQRQFYQCLRTLRSLIPREDRLLAAYQS